MGQQSCTSSFWMAHIWKFLLKKYLCVCTTPFFLTYVCFGGEILREWSFRARGKGPETEHFKVQAIFLCPDGVDALRFTLLPLRRLVTISSLRKSCSSLKGCRNSLWLSDFWGENSSLSSGKHICQMFLCLVQGNWSYCRFSSFCC